MLRNECCDEKLLAGREKKKGLDMLNKFMFAFPAAAMAVSASATELAFDIGAGVTSNYNAAVAADVTRIVKTGDGTLVLEQAAASGFEGVTEVKGGTLVVHNRSALGNAAANTVTVSDGATFKVENLTNEAINNKFLVAGDGFDGQGALCYNRGTAATVNAELPFSTIELTGDASFSKNGRAGFGTLVLNGHTFTYPSTKGESSGDFMWNWSTIDGTGGGHVVVKKEITLQGAVTFKGTAANTLTLDGSAMRTYDAKMTFPWTLISTNGSFQVHSTSAESGIQTKNMIDGPVQIVDSLRLTGSTYGRLAGPISGAGGVTSAYSHHYLTGTNTYEGATKVTGGTLTIASERSLPGYDQPNRVTVSYSTLELTMSPLFTGWDFWSGEALQDLLANMTVSGGAISLRTPSGVGTTKDIPKSVHHHGEGTLITEGKKSGDGMIYNDQGNWVFRAPSTVTQELAYVNVYKGTMAFVNQQITNVGEPRWALSPDRQDATWVQHGGKTWTTRNCTLSVNYTGGLGEYRVEAGAEVAFSNSVNMVEGDANAAYAPMSVFVADGTGTVFECQGNFYHDGNSNSTSLVCVNNGAALGARRFARGTTETARPDRKSYFAFNGGELRSLWEWALFNAEDQSQIPDRVFSFENGLAVNSCGTTTDWISFNLEAPTGLGITEVTLPTEATEATYEAPPKMRLAGGDGVAAWVYADWDPATKKVAAKAKIASPGVDFTVAPTCTVEKPDGSGTWACAVTIGKCKSGGVRKVGPGNMQLPGTHTYEGPTIVEEGVLTFSGRLGSNSQFPTNSAIIVCKDATLSLAQYSAYTVKSISGGGKVWCNGTITVLDGIEQDADTLLRDERTYVEGKIAFGADAKVVIREPEKLVKGKRYLLTETTEGFSGTLPTLVTDGTAPIENGKVQIRNDRYLYFSISQGMTILFK